jgi:hypothetical protein
LLLLLLRWFGGRGDHLFFRCRLRGRGRRRGRKGRSDSTSFSSPLFLLLLLLLRQEELVPVVVLVGQPVGRPHALFFAAVEREVVHLVGVVVSLSLRDAPAWLAL